MLSKQEFERLQSRLTAEPLDISGVASQNEDQGYFERIKNDFLGAAEDTLSDISRQNEAITSGKSMPEVFGKVAETGLRTAGRVASLAFSPITEALSPVIKPVVEKLMSIPGASDAAGKISEWAKANPNAAKDLGAVFDIATLGLGSPAGKALKGVAESTGSAIKTTGGALKGVAEKAYSIATPMTEATTRAIQAYEAAKPTLFERMKGLITGDKLDMPVKPTTEAQTAAKLGLAGTEWQIGVQAKKATGKLWNDIIQPALNSVKEKVDMRKFLGDLKKRIIAETPELTRRNTLLDAWSSIAEDFKKVGQVSYNKLQEYKEGWAKFVPERVYKGKPISGAFNDVKNMASQEARAEIYGKLGDEIKQAYFDYGNLQSIIEAGIKSIDPLRSKGVTKQVWEFIMDKTITPISSYGGKVLYKTGEGLEFIGEQGAKKIGDLLEQGGKIGTIGAIQIVNPLKSEQSDFKSGAVPQTALEVTDELKKALVDAESSGGADRRNEKLDAGKFGWLVGFTKGTYNDIVKKAKTDKRYKELLPKIDLDTREGAINSAFEFMKFLNNRYNEKGEIIGQEYNNWIDIYANLYNASGSTSQEAAKKNFEEKLIK